MTDATFAERLVARFNPRAAAQFDGAFCIDTGEQRLALRVHEQRLEALPDRTPVDLTIYFADLADAEAILAGRGDVIEAFMQGRLRSDGYLIWVFTVLAMFRG